MSRRAPRSLSSALGTLTAELAPATTLARVQEAWAATVGPAIAASARPAAERAGVLTISLRRRRLGARARADGAS